MYTPYKELDIVLEDYAQKLNHALKGNLVGVYLQGSLAIGDFDMTSDVDFVVNPVVVVTPDLSSTSE